MSVRFDRELGRVVIEGYTDDADARRQYAQYEAAALAEGICPGCAERLTRTDDLGSCPRHGSWRLRTVGEDQILTHWADWDSYAERPDL